MNLFLLLPIGAVIVVAIGAFAIFVLNIGGNNDEKSNGERKRAAE